MKHGKIRLLALVLVLVSLLAAGCSGDALKQSTGMTAVSGKTVTISETVLYEAEGVKITATGLEAGLVGPEIKLTIENSSEKNVLVTTDKLSANGYMMPLAGLYAEVAAGKNANESITLYTSDLEQSGVETLAKLEFYLKLQNPENYEVMATSELITLPTSEAGHTQAVDDSGDVIYAENGIKVVCKGLKQDAIWDGTVVFYMENSCGQPISVYAENVSVNGYMQDVSLWSDMRDGTRIVDGMNLLDLSDLQLSSIDEVEQIELSLRIVNADNWNEITTTEPITLSFS